MRDDLKVASDMLRSNAVQQSKSCSESSGASETGTVGTVAVDNEEEYVCADDTARDTRRDLDCKQMLA